MFVCKHDGRGGCVNADMWPMFWLSLFLFIFDPGRYVPEYSSDSNASQKLKKSKRKCRICLSWILRNAKGYKIVHARIECRIVWVLSRYTCHFKRIFSVFRLQPLCIYVIYANSWINTERPSIVWIRSGNHWAVRRWQTGRGMALTAIQGVSQWGAAGCSGSRTTKNIWKTEF